MDEISKLKINIKEKKDLYKKKFEQCKTYNI